jgi:hypothetical protein
MTTGGPEQPAGGFDPPPLEYPSAQGPLYPAPPPTYPTASGYYPGAAWDPYRPLKPPGTNNMAVASMVCSLVGLTCCGLTSIVGVILGVIAMRETRRTGQDGNGFALAGIIIGGLAIAGWAVYILLYVALLASGWQWI